MSDLKDTTECNKDNKIRILIILQTKMMTRTDKKCTLQQKQQIIISSTWNICRFYAQKQNNKLPAALAVLWTFLCSFQFCLKQS